MPIRPFLKDAVFGPDVISVMGAAFEDVCKTLEGLGWIADERAWQYQREGCVCPSTQNTPHRRRSRASRQFAIVQMALR